MSAWVHLFSRFTTELLFFEIVAILVLCTGYCAAWIFKKRKLGAVEEVVPSGMVKIYLNDLIQQAELVRTQLFGLLGAGSPVDVASLSKMIVQTAPAVAAQQTPSSTPATPPGAAADAGKLKELEAKIQQQHQAMQTLETEKKKIETELTEARNASSKGSAGGGGNESETAELKKKIKLLEDRLAEYSIIEDDLANLKRLQQENAQLKASLEGKGIPAPAAAATAAATPVAAAVAEPAPEPAPAAGAENPGFEGLVDKVEASLQTDTPAAETAAVAPTPAPAATPAAPETPAPASAQAAPAAEPKAATPPTGKNDEDLLSEFEKMLNM